MLGGPCRRQRQAQELISDPNPTTKVRLLSWVITVILTGNNTLRRRSHLTEMSNNLNCRKCTEEETSVHIMCECETLASLIHTHLASFFFDPEDIRKLSVGAILNFAEGTWLL
jgi:hypothetical protein